MKLRHALLLCSLLARLAWAGPEGGIEVPPEVLKEFQAIEGLAAKQDFAEAERRIQALMPSLQNNPPARALLLRSLGSLYGMQKHYAHAAGILEQSLGLNALPPSEAQKARFELAQYQLATGDYPKAAETLRAWIEQAPAPQPEHYLLLADIRAQLKQYDVAAALVEQAIAHSSQPKPEWYMALVSFRHEAREPMGCARALTALIERYPDNPLYWNQLTGVYQEAGHDKEALAVRQLMHKRGMLKSSAEIMQLAQVLRYRNLHSRAAELLQEEIERGGIEATAPNLELLAQAWTDAKELRKAATALEKAAQAGGGAEVDFRLGQIYSELRDWAKAEQVLARAVAGKPLKNPGAAYLLLGMAHYRLKEKDQARAAFSRAQGMPAARATAEQWLKHLDQEAKQGARSKG